MNMHDRTDSAAKSEAGQTRPRQGKSLLSPDPDKSSADRGTKTVVLGVVKWSCAALVLVLIFHHLTFSPQSDEVVGPQALTLAVSPQNCHALPPHGAVHIMEPSVMRRTDVLFSGLQIDNRHDYPMVAVLSDASSQTQYLAVSVEPDKTTRLSVPVAEYSLTVFVGSDWCNLESGFSDGARVSVDGGIAIEAGLITALEFYGAGIDPVHLALASSTFRPTILGQENVRPSEVVGAGELELRQAGNGHYFSSGTINDAPVVFMVDTGATYVSISTEMAKRVGVQKCHPHQVMTANGSVNACAATVPELTFGAFLLTNVEVTVIPNMSDEALLGMNVLRHFRIEQVDNVMRISSR